ncbi:MAG: hypothetical protein AAB424_00390 [Patescibacteria group bacterium]
MLSILVLGIGIAVMFVIAGIVVTAFGKMAQNQTLVHAGLTTIITSGICGVIILIFAIAAL